MSIIGLWIGFFFWATVASLFTERCSVHLLKLDRSRPDDAVGARKPVPSSAPDPEPEPEPVVDELSPLSDSFVGLTARQLQVLALLADGLRYREIADALAISPRQVQRHVAGAVERMGSRTPINSSRSRRPTASEADRLGGLTAVKGAVVFAWAP